MFKINKVIKAMVFSDLVFLFGWGLIDPIFAVFVLTNIQGGGAKVAGIAIGVYWIVKSLAMIPISKILDKTDGEKDDFLVMIGGVLVSAVVPIIMLFVSLPWHLYLLKIIHGIAMAFVLPAWCGIFTRHIDKGKEAFSWSLDSSALGFGAGVAGILGGVVAQYFGFKILFVAVSLMSFLSCLFLISVRKHLLRGDKEKVISFPKPY